MAVSTSILKNLGSSIAYTSLDVVSQYAPNTGDLLRAGVRGANDAMAVARQMKAADRTVVGRRSRRLLENAVKSIKEGSVTLNSITGKIDTSADGMMSDAIGDMRDEEVEQETDEPTNFAPQSTGSDVLSKTQLRMMAKTAQYNVDALNQLQTVLATTQVDSAEYTTMKIGSAIYTQSNLQQRHFTQIEKQLTSINSNLTKILEYQANQQSNVNLATMAMFDQLSGYIRRSEARELEKAKLTKRAKAKAGDGFMGSNILDLSQYKDIIDENLKNSEIGALRHIAGTIDDVFLQKGRGPKGVAGMLAKMLVPRGVQRSMKSGDRGLNTMLKTMLSRLGEYRYDMKNHPVLGMLGSLFGVDQRVGRTVKLSGFKRGEMSWNGEAQKALINVIPKELAEINANTRNQLHILQAIANERGLVYDHSATRYFDMQTGHAMGEDEILERTQTRFQDAMESSFANIFNKISIDPDDIMDKKIWEGFSDSIKDQINTVLNRAIEDGITTEHTKELDQLVRNNMGGSGGTERDLVRMVNELVQAVNVSRDNLSTLARDLAEQESGFLQIASNLRGPNGESLVNEAGNISYGNLRKYLGQSGIDIRAANAGKYSQSGKRLDYMTEEERARIVGQDDMISEGLRWVSNLDQSSNRVLSGIGHRAKNAIYGRNTKYSQAASNAVDSFYNGVYRATMLGERPQLNVRERRSGAGSAGRATTSRSANDSGGDSGGEGDGERPKRGRGQKFRPGAVINQAFSQKEEGQQYDPQNRTAEATEELRDVTQEAFGEKGFMRKFYDNPLFKKIFEKVKNSKVGQWASKQKDKAGEYIRRLFTEDTVDEEGNEIKSTKTMLKEGFVKYRDFLLGKLGFNPEKGEAVESPDGQPTIVDEVADINESVRETRQILTGEDSGGKTKPETKVKSLLAQMNKAIHKYAPKAGVGAAIGGTAGLLAGGKIGLLGGLFLPGGPIGGAIMGAGLGLLSQTNVFKDVLFGKAGDDGERQGGLINKEMQASFKKALPTLGIGAAVGGLGYTITKFLGMGMGRANLMGAGASALLPGGPLGAVVLGSAAAMALKNEKVQNILFGEKDEDGKRTGSFLSKAYNSFTAKMRGAQGKDGKGSGKIGTKALKLLKSAGLGALTATTISQMGLLGASFGLGGPIGGAIAGLAVGMLGGVDKFDNYLYGTKDEDGKRKKDGLFSRAATMIQMQILEPAGNWFQNTMVDFAWWLKDKVEVPLRIVTAPIVEAFHGAADSVTEAGKAAFKKVGDSLVEKFGGIASKIGKFIMTKVLGTAGKAVGGVLKAGLFGAGTMLSLPLQGLELLMSGQKRKANKDLRQKMRANKEGVLNSARAAREARGEENTRWTDLSDRVNYALSSNRFIGGFFRNSEFMNGEGGVIDQYVDYQTRNGKEFNRKTIINEALKDRYQYKQARKQAQQNAKEEGRIGKMRRKFAAEDDWNQEKILDGTEEFEKRQKAVKKKFGIEINNAEEMRDFIYNYDKWKHKDDPKEEKKAEVGSPEYAAQQEQDHHTEKIGVIEKWGTSITGWLEKIFNKNSRIADVEEAQLDIVGGETVDTEDFSEGEDISGAIDTDKAAEVQDEKAAAQANATVDALRAIEKEKERKAQRDILTGNDSGNAHDEEDFAPINPFANDSDKDEEPKEEKKGGIFDMLGGVLQGGLSSVLKFIAPAGIAALVGTLLLNEDVREFLADAAGGLFKFILDKGGELIKNLPGIIWEGVKNIPEAASTALGLNGGVNNSRALEVDEEGNATKTVLNSGLISHGAKAVWNGGKTVQAAGKVVDFATDHAPLVGNIVRGLKGKDANALSGLGGKAANFAGKTVRKGVTKAANAVKDAAKSDNGNMLSKAFSLIEKGLNAAAESKAGQFFKKVAGGLKKVAEFFASLKQKLADKIFGKAAEKLTAALAAAGVTSASWLTPMALLNAAVTAGAAILGALDAASLFCVNDKDVDAKMRVISAIMEGLCAASGMAALVSCISDIVAEFTEFDFMQQIAVFLYKAISDEEGDEKIDKAIENMKQEVANYNLANNTNLSVQAYNDLKNKGTLGNAWNAIQGLWGGGDRTDYSQYEVGNFDASKYQNQSTGKGGGRSTAGSQKPTGYGGRRVRGGRRVGMGGYRQNDARWGNMPLGRMNNGTMSTMAMGGCGPTALANAINHLGGNVNPAELGQFAADNGYISDGGANDGLFDEGAPSLGVGTNRLTSTDDVLDSLNAGMPVVLAGKDNSSRTPFTNMGHIVTATGVDHDGNIIVDDPERDGAYAYNPRDLGSKLTASWSVGAHATPVKKDEPSKPTGYGALLDAIGGAITKGLMSAFGNAIGIDLNSSTVDSVANGEGTTVDANGNVVDLSMNGTYTKIDASEAAKFNWNWLSKHGYSDIAKAGIMGCWQQESSNRSDRVEGDYLKGFPGFSSVLASNNSLNQYTQGTLFPAYARSNISINKNAYKGKDGNYYPGVGLAQWTGPRGYNLFQYAIGNNKDWRDATTQLLFFEQESLARGLKGSLNSARTVSEATERMLDGYEMSKGYSAKHPKAFNKRLGFANGIYELYKGTARVSGAGSSSSSGSTGKGGARGYGHARGYGIADSLFGSIGSLFSDLLLRSLGISTGDTTTGYTGTDDYANGLTGSGSIGTWTGYNPFDTSGQTGGSTAGGKYTYSGPGLPGQIAVVNMMGSKYKQLRYSTSETQNVDAGVSSCADTVSWAYMRALGTNRMSAGAGYSSQDPQFTTIWTNSGGQQPDLRMLQPGDIIYQDWRTTKYVPSSPQKMSHAEMYAGYGYDLSHGGGRSGNEMGPVLSKLSGDNAKHVMMVRRYTPFIQQAAEYARQQNSSTSGSTTTAAQQQRAEQLMQNRELRGMGGHPRGGRRVGMGGSQSYGQVFDFGDMGKGTPTDILGNSLKTAVGDVGTGIQTSVNDSGMASLDDTATGYGSYDSASSGVESRLDRIIDILTRIADNGSAMAKAKPPIQLTTNNVNYGEGDKTNVQPVIVNTEKKQLGGEDAQNQELRAMHRQLASVKRFT